MDVFFVSERESCQGFICEKMVEKYYRIYVPVHLPEGCLQGMGIFKNLFLKGKRERMEKYINSRYESDSPKGGSFGKGSGKVQERFGKDPGKIRE